MEKGWGEGMVRDVEEGVVRMWERAWSENWERACSHVAHMCACVCVCDVYVTLPNYHPV